MIASSGTSRRKALIERSILCVAMISLLTVHASVVLYIPLEKGSALQS
jgi:hypothetical protein